MRILNSQSWRVGCHSSDLVTGRVVIVRSHADLDRVNKGDILVAQQTDVNYTPQMLGAIAIITEDGGRYSHAATFSRERRIPCLIGVVGIMDSLNDYDTITIDTHKKSITIVATSKNEGKLK